MLKILAELADKLDERGLHKEADMVDALIKNAVDEEALWEQWRQLYDKFIPLEKQLFAQMKQGLLKSTNWVTPEMKKQIQALQFETSGEGPSLTNSGWAIKLLGILQLDKPNDTRYGSPEYFRYLMIVSEVGFVPDESLIAQMQELHNQGNQIYDQIYANKE